MSNAFYTSGPYGIGKMFLAKGSEEHHIFPDLHDAFYSAYTSNTSNAFIDDAYDFMVEMFSDKLIEHGRDEMCTEDGNISYIWVHLNKSTGKEDIKEIKDALEDKYVTVWSKYKVATLLSIIKNELEDDPKCLAYAVSDYQRRHGFEQTENTLHILFNDIM